MKDIDAEVVQKLVNAFPNSVFIAGGYLRDTLAGIPYSDVDVWVLQDAGFPSPHHIKMAVEMDVEVEGSEYVGGSLSLRVSPTDVNVILAPRSDSSLNIAANDVVQKFDIDICRLFYLPDRDYLFKSTQYKQDVENKTLTVRLPALPYNPPQDQRDPVAKTMLYRIPKMLEKFPDHEVKIVYEKR